MKKLPKLINFRPLFFVFIALLCGILLAPKLFLGKIVAVILTATILLTILLICIFYKKFYTLILLFSFFFVGVAGYAVADVFYRGNVYEIKQDIVGRVADNFSIKDNYAFLVIEDVFIQDKKSKNISLTVFGSDLDIAAGDIISFNAYLNNVKLFELGNFKSYYYRDNVAYTSQININEASLVSGDLRVDEKLRLSLKNILIKNMSKENAGLAFAVLTGNKSVLDDDIKDVYASAGIVHLLAVSGLHITFLTGLLYFVLKRLKTNKFVNLAIVLLFLGFYCFICSFSPSVLRASIMSITFLLAGLFGKEYDKLSTLSVAGLLILIFSPLSAFDVGFLLSFGCVLTIFCLVEPIKYLFSRIFPQKCANLLAVSLAAQIGVLPFLSIFTNQINLLSVFANFLIIPLFSFVYPLLFLTCMLSFLPFSNLIFMVVDLVFGFILNIATIFSNTAAVINFETFEIYMILFFFIFIFILSYFVMTNLKFKALVLSFLYLFFCMFYFVDFKISQNVQPVIASISTYGNTNYFLVNENKEVLFVGNSFGNLEEKWLKQNKIENVDFCLILNCESGDADGFLNLVQDFNTESVVTLEPFSNLMQESLIAQNTASFIGTYLFEYICFNDELIGLEINVDDSKFFFTTGSVLSYNENVYLKTYATNLFDFAFIGKRVEFAQEFEGTKNIFGYYNNNYVDFSYAEFGNIEYCYNKNKIRSIDF